MEINKIGANIPMNQSISNSSPVEKGSKDAEMVEKAVEKAVEKKDIKTNQKDLKAAVELANKVLFKNNTHLKFEIHEKTKEVMVRIVEDETGEVVKEIPPEKMLDMVAKLWEIAGIIVDEKR